MNLPTRMWAYTQTTSHKTPCFLMLPPPDPPPSPPLHPIPYPLLAVPQVMMDISSTVRLFTLPKNKGSGPKRPNPCMPQINQQCVCVCVCQVMKMSIATKTVCLLVISMSSCPSLSLPQRGGGGRDPRLFLAPGRGLSLGSGCSQISVTSHYPPAWRSILRRLHPVTINPS